MPRRSFSTPSIYTNQTNASHISKLLHTFSMFENDNLISFEDGSAAFGLAASSTPLIYSQTATPKCTQTETQSEDSPEELLARFNALKESLDSDGAAQDGNTASPSIDPYAVVLIDAHSHRVSWFPYPQSPTDCVSVQGKLAARLRERRWLCGQVTPQSRYRIPWASSPGKAHVPHRCTRVREPQGPLFRNRQETALSARPCRFRRWLLA